MSRASQLPNENNGDIIQMLYADQIILEVTAGRQVPVFITSLRWLVSHSQALWPSEYAQIAVTDVDQLRVGIILQLTDMTDHQMLEQTVDSWTGVSIQSQVLPRFRVPMSNNSQCHDDDIQHFHSFTTFRPYHWREFERSLRLLHNLCYPQVHFSSYQFLSFRYNCSFYRPESKSILCFRRSLSHTPRLFTCVMTSDLTHSHHDY